MVQPKFLWAHLRPSPQDSSTQRASIYLHIIKSHAKLKMFPCNTQQHRNCIIMTCLASTLLTSSYSHVQISSCSSTTALSQLQGMSQCLIHAKFRRLRRSMCASELYVHFCGTLIAFEHVECYQIHLNTISNPRTNYSC